MNASSSIVSLDRAARQVNTPIGRVIARASDAGVVSIWFGADGHAGLASADRGPATRHLDHLSRLLSAYFEGNEDRVDIPVIPVGTDFQHQVWNALLQIPAGQTRSYADIARAIGRPSACRAVARANATNPVPILIPCHRVIGSDGSLTGYGGGLDRKRWLLDHEARHWGCVASASPFASQLLLAGGL